MKTGIYLSYIGLGANLLHLSYCHQIAKKTWTRNDYNIVQKFRGNSY